VTFEHDTVVGMAAVVELVNSAEAPDTMVTLADLREFVARHDFVADRLDGTDLAQLRALRPQLRRLLTSPRDDAVEQVNAMLREAGALPQLVRHGGSDWHVHAVPTTRPLTERIAVEAAMAMTEVIRDDELSRLAECAADGCRGLVFDLSRNRSRRFCSAACGNRLAVAAYRARRSGTV
jgi:predicted RNA-binding Zn ribbon-like protein